MKTLSVKSVSLLTGISTHTLRAWEKRYEAVVPLRSDSGQRRYSEEQVERLKLLRRVVDLGHAISQVAPLSNDELKNLAFEGPALKKKPEEKAAQLIVDEIIFQLKKLNLTKVAQLVRKAKHIHATKNFVLQVISPLFGQIGELVDKGELDISQEHALSTIVKYNMSEIFYSLQNNPFYQNHTEQELAPVVTLATAEGELHEFGILSAGVLCALNGLNSYYLGPNLPSTSLAWLANSVQSDIVLIGTSPVAEENRLRDFLLFLDEVDQKLMEGCEIWVGGELCHHINDTSRYRHRLKLIPTLKKCYERLEERQKAEPALIP